MRISEWSSYVCSSDLTRIPPRSSVSTSSLIGGPLHRAAIASSIGTYITMSSFMSMRQSVTSEGNAAMPHAYIIDAVRTPRGIGKQGAGEKKGGALAAMHPQHQIGRAHV